MCVCLRRMTEKELDFGPYDKDEPEESDVRLLQTRLLSRRAKKKKKKKKRLIRSSLLSGTKSLRQRNDHETTEKNLVKNTKSVRVHIETHKEDYDTVYYMWTLSANLMSLHNINDPDNKIKKNAHAAFIKYFRNVQHDYGFPVYVCATPSPAGSKNVSRAASVVPFDNSIDEGSMEEDEYDDEDAGAGAA